MAMTVSSGNREDPLHRMLAGCVVQVHGNRFGTGFVAAPGKVVTCAHVVAWAESVTIRAAGGTTLPVSGTTGLLPKELLSRTRYPMPDLVVLDVVGLPDGQPCVRLGRELPAHGQDLLLAAWTKGAHTPGVDALTHTSLVYEGITREQVAPEEVWELLKLTNGQIVPGFSGGPLLDRATGRVCGIVDSTRSEAFDLGGFAIPAAVLSDHVDDELQRLNEAFHDADPRWDRALEASRVAEAEASGRRLPLMRKAPRRERTLARRSASEFLRADRQVVQYLEPPGLLEDVARWRDSANPTRVLLLSGPGGCGKTRTALEMCAGADAVGWTSGFLPRYADPDAVAAWPGRVLVVIDAAEADPSWTSDVLTRLIRREPAPAVRVVLISRRGDRWLDEVFHKADGVPWGSEVVDLLKDVTRVRLDASELTLDRARLFDRAAATFAAELGGDVGPAPDLDAEHFALPLLVLAAALLAVGQPALPLEGLDERSLLEAVLDRHERTYWAGSWREGSPPAAEVQELLVGLSALLGARDAEELDVILRLTEDPETQIRRARVTAWLRRLYEQEDEPWLLAGPEPDLLAEVLVARILARQPRLVAEALDAALPDQLTQALTVAGRGACWDAGVQQSVRDALDVRLPRYVDLASADDDDRLARALAGAVSATAPVTGAVRTFDTVSVDRSGDAVLAVEVLQLAVGALGAPQQPETSEGPEPQARAVSRLATALRKIGQHDKSHRQSRRAVQLWEQLFAQDRRHALGLARALHDESNGLFDRGNRDDWDEGFSKLQRGAKIAEEQIPDPWTAAFLWKTLASHAADAQRVDIGLLAAERALRGLGTDHEALADVYSARSALLGLARRPEESIEAGQQAVAHAAAAAGDDPRAALRSRATTSLNLAAALLRAGRPAEATEPARGAVEMFEALHEEWPGLYARQLANSLKMWGAVLAGGGDPLAGVDLLDDAVGLLVQIGQGDGLSRDFADTVIDRAAIACESADPSRGLADLENVAGWLQANGDDARADPARLARALVNLTRQYMYTGRYDDALDSADAAIRVSERLMNVDEGAGALALAAALGNKAVLIQVDQADDSVDLLRRAVHLRQAHTLLNDLPGRRDLASVMADLGASQVSAGDPRAAVVTLREAVAMLEPMVAVDVPGSVRSLLRARMNLAVALAEAGDPRAVAAADSALAAALDWAGSDATASGDALDALHDAAYLRAGLDDQAGRSELAISRLETLIDTWARHQQVALELSLVRAEVLATLGRLGDAVDAMWHLASLASEDDAGDTRVRALVRKLKSSDPEAFGHSWAERVGLQPAWLAEQPDPGLADLIRRWMSQETWAKSYAVLGEWAVELCTARGLSTMTAMVDEHPGNADVREHFALLAFAAENGVASTIDAHRAARAE